MRNSVKNLLKFGLGFLSGILLMLVISLLVLASGMVDMSATAEPGKIESTLAPWAFERSMARRAPKAKNPHAADATALVSGMSHYRANCVICHGAPDVAPAELAPGLNPPAPALHSADVQALSDGELFWIVKNGIRMTGMPAFGVTHSDDEIWHIVAFVRHLPKITEAEQKALQAATKEEAEHHHEGAVETKETKHEH